MASETIIKPLREDNRYVSIYTLIVMTLPFEQHKIRIGLIGEQARTYTSRVNTDKTSNVLCELITILTTIEFNMLIDSMIIYWQLESKGIRIEFDLVAFFRLYIK